MEFKGTKGKWRIKDISVEREWVNITSDKDIIARTFYGDKEPIVKKKEAKANALLISKAPEMLEMLNKFVEAIENEEIVIKENFDNDGFENCGNRLYNEFKQLIKESTEL
jgi:hypothetical protein